MLELLSVLLPNYNLLEKQSSRWNLHYLQKEVILALFILV